ncbi:hypothetical protein GCM10027048_45080 [Hymenobacter coalescens]
MAVSGRVYAALQRLPGGAAVQPVGTIRADAGCSPRYGGGFPNRRMTGGLRPKHLARQAS